MKNITSKNKLGFSLIELSIVILVIGILVIGITKGSRIIKDARLKSARSLTISSPVSSTSGLVTWLETTLEKSFDDGEKVDTAIGETGTITTWYDINPQNSSLNNATQSGASSLNPRYIADGINGLPALNFDGNSSDYGDDSLQMSNVTTKDYTVFIVLKTQYSGFGTGVAATAFSSSCVLWSDITGKANDVIPFAIGGGFAKTFVGAGTVVVGTTVTGSIAINNNKANIVTITRMMSTGLLSIYINGVADNSSTLTTNVLSDNPNLFIGANQLDAGRNYAGEISEIIIFNRVLKDNERGWIDDYLKTKWGIS